MTWGNQNSKSVKKRHDAFCPLGHHQGERNGPYIAVYNHTTGTLSEFHSAITGLAIPATPLILVIVYLVSIFSIFFYGIGIIVLVGLTVYRSSRKKQLLATFRTAVDAAVSQIKGLC